MEIVNPTISVEQLQANGFKIVWDHPDPEIKGSTWSMQCECLLDARGQDYLEIFWFCGTQRYRIMRQTKGLKNIFQFEGFLYSIDDLKRILSMLDLSKFYDHV